MGKYITLCFFSIGVLICTPHFARTQWVQTNGLTGDFINCFAVNDSNIYTGTYNNGVFLSTNAGISWNEVNDGLTSMNVQTLAAIGSRVFAGTKDSGIFLSTNQGASWKEVNADLPEVCRYVTTLTVKGTHLYAGFTYKGVFRSTDFGTSWHEANEGLSDLHIVALGVKDSLLIAATRDYGIFSSADNGASWISVNYTLLNVVSLVTLKGDLFAGASLGGVSRSTDNGITWKFMDLGANNTVIYSLIVNDSNLFAGAYNGDIYLSTNSGKTWTNVNKGLPGVNIFALAASGQYLYCGTQAGGVWKRPLSQMVKSSAVPMMETTSLALQQCYPNPFTSSTTINYTLPQRSMVRLEVYDVLGRKVAALVGGVMEAGQQSVEFDARNLAHGVYTAKLTVNGIEHEIKMLVSI